MFEAIPSASGNTWIVTNGVDVLFTKDNKPREFKSQALADHEAMRLNGGELSTTLTDGLSETYSHMPKEIIVGDAVILGGDWATDEMAQVIADADSRCQGSVIHRRMGIIATTTVDVFGVGKVKVCEQCQDFYNPLGKHCQYSAAHNIRAIKADVVIDCGPVGIVPACRPCAEFYIHASDRNRNGRVVCASDFDHEGSMVKCILDNEHDGPHEDVTGAVRWMFGRLYR